MQITAEQCNDNKVVTTQDGRIGYCAWFPQMGGYTAKCIIIPGQDDTNKSVDILVWHNGDFPFAEG